jgi:hypothetical protein
MSDRRKQMWEEVFVALVAFIALCFVVCCSLKREVDENAAAAAAAAAAPIVPPGTFNGNWSQQNLADPATEGCPGQYKTWTDVNNLPFLTGCWGHK